MKIAVMVLNVLDTSLEVVCDSQAREIFRDQKNQTEQTTSQTEQTEQTRSLTEPDDSK